MTEALPWQVNEAQYYDRRRHGLLWEPGTGKTWVMVQTIAHWTQQSVGVGGALVLAPNGVHEGWADEIRKHWPLLALPEIFVWDAASAKKRGLLRRWCQDEPRPGARPRIVLANVETMSHEMPKRELFAWFQSARRHGETLFILDEFHGIRSPAAKRSRACWALGSQATVARILSGTPMPKGWHNLYSPFRVLGWPCLGAPTFAAFKEQFCVLRPMSSQGRTFTVIDGYKNLDVLQARIDRVATRQTLDAAGLPPALGGITGTVPLTVKVRMNREQRAHYEELQQHALTILSDGTPITAEQAIALTARLQQITGGGIIHPDKRVTIFGSPKIEATINLVEACETPVLVWCRYRHEVDMVAQALAAALEDRPVYRHHGGVGTAERSTHRTDWGHSDGGVLVATAATLGTGYTLNAAKLSVFYSCSFVYEERYQAERRNLRIGQGKTVSYWDVLCADTIDEHVLAVLRRGQDLQNLLMRAAPRDTLRDLLTEPPTL